MAEKKEQILEVQYGIEEKPIEEEEMSRMKDMSQEGGKNLEETVDRTQFVTRKQEEESEERKDPFEFNLPFTSQTTHKYPDPKQI